MSKLQISLDQLKAFHQEFDERMTKFNIVCSKGCSFCCYQFVPVMSFEVNYIKDAVRRLKPSVKEQVKKQYLLSMQHFLDNTPDQKEIPFQQVYQDYAKLVGRDWIACPLLVDNKCSIYEIRPFTCQLHFQLDDPQICKKNNIRDADPEALRLMAGLVKFLVTSGEFRLVSILMLLKEVFEKKRKVPTIEPQKFTI